jgi:hypothetical protein
MFTESLPSNGPHVTILYRLIAFLSISQNETEFQSVTSVTSAEEFVSNPVSTRCQSNMERHSPT